MPFTTCNYLTIGSGTWRPDTTFYPQDITMVMAQNGAVTTRVINAIFNHPSGGTEECMILIALDVNRDPMAEDHNFAALSCPPFDENGGVFEPQNES